MEFNFVNVALGLLWSGGTISVILIIKSWFDDRKRKKVDK
jgi:hypothetical protein